MLMYRMKTPITQAEIGRRLKKHRQRIWAIVNGKEPCSPDMAIAIEKASEGRYKAVKLCPELKGYAKHIMRGMR
jgi:hypothetical protein